MRSPMSVEQAERVAAGAGVATLFIGAALAVAPERVGAAAGLVQPAGARAIGVADLALVPGLITGRPRWPWMAARAGLNVAIVGYARRLDRAGAPRVGLLARALTGITVVDTMAAVSMPMASGSGGAASVR